MKRALIALLVVLAVAVPSAQTQSGSTRHPVVALNTTIGRTQINYYAASAAAGATGTETAITLTKASGTSATTTAVTFAIPVNKRYRISAISVGARGNAVATAQVTTFSIRINTAGAVTTATTPIILQAVVATPATSSAYDRVLFPLEDGFEITGSATLQFGVTANAVYVTNAPTWDVMLIGYLY